MEEKWFGHFPQPLPKKVDNSGFVHRCDLVGTNFGMPGQNSGYAQLYIDVGVFGIGLDKGPAWWHFIPHEH